MNIKNFFDKIAGFFRGPEWRKAKEISVLISELLPYAITAVEVVGKLSGNKEVDNIAALLNKLNVPQEEFNFDPTRNYTNSEIQGILMGAARFAVKGQLDKAIEEAGEAGLIFSGQKIKSSDLIPDNVINTATQTAYSFVKNYK